MSGRHNQELAHRALILVLKNMAVVHVRSLGTCIVRELHEQRNDTVENRAFESVEAG